MFDPMLATNSRTFSSSPRPIEETPMTTATPITMPSTVNAERNLLLRIVSAAMRKISPNSPLRIISFGCRLPEAGSRKLLHFKPQCHDRIQQRSLARGIDSKKHSYARGHQQSGANGPQLNR